MKTILVTGASGFVGKHLIDEILRHHKFRVIGLGRKDFFYPDNNFSYLKCDLLNRNDLKQIDFKQVDKIIHLAANSSVALSFKYVQEFINNNINSEVNLFEEVKTQKAQLDFLIVSSGSVYSSHVKPPIKEIDLVDVYSPYSLTKLFQEELAKYYFNLGFKVVIARPFNHIGPNQSTGFLVPDLIEQILRIKKGHKKEIRVGNLNSKRDYTDVRDVVKAYYLLIDSFNFKKFEIYNVCSGKSISGQELLSQILTLANLESIEIKTEAKLIRPIDNPDIYGSFNKIKKDFGWKPVISLKHSLEDILRLKNVI